MAGFNRYTPVTPQTIPAKAGISQPYAATTKHQSTNNSPFPHRPFLRRQESHNHMRQRRVESAKGGMPIVAHNQTPIRPHTPVHQKTIPAKAGISQPCAATPRRIRQRRHANCRPQPNTNPPTHSRPPQDHSCEGRNLLAATTATTKPKSTHSPPFPHRPFLRRQESHNHVRQRRHRIRQRRHANCSPQPKHQSAHTLPSTTRPFLRRQESHNHVRQRRVESAKGGMPIVAHNQTPIRPHTSVPHRPFLRRQESHNYVPPTAASLIRNGELWHTTL